MNSQTNPIRQFVDGYCGSSFDVFVKSPKPLDELFNTIVQLVCQVVLDVPKSNADQWREFAFKRE